MTATTRPPVRSLRTAEVSPAARARLLKRADAIYAELHAKYPRETAHAQQPQWELSTRMRTVLGRCWTHSGRIRLTVLLAHPLVDPSLADEVIRHELAHLFAPLAEGHGPAWQRWAVKCGAKPVRMLMLHDYMPSNVTTATRRTQYRYVTANGVEAWLNQTRHNRAQRGATTYAIGSDTITYTGESREVIE